MVHPQGTPRLLGLVDLLTKVQLRCSVGSSAVFFLKQAEAANLCTTTGSRPLVDAIHTLLKQMPLQQQFSQHAFK